MAEIENPFKAENIKEIPLTKAPLVRVIAQVRFPTIVSIEEAKFIAGFQELLRHEYPVFRSEKNLIVNLFDVTDKRQQTTWKLFDSSEKWRITLAPDFLALETLDYTSRTDFYKRFKVALDALYNNVKPDYCERLGVRYIDQVKGDTFKNIKGLVRKELLGVYGSGISEHISSSLRQTVFNVNQDTCLTSRWGVLGPLQTYDAASVEPINEPSWIIDLDVFSQKKQDFNCEIIHKKAVEFSSLAYNFFRWSVNDDFLRAYGGKI